MSCFSVASQTIRRTRAAAKRRFLARIADAPKERRFTPKHLAGKFGGMKTLAEPEIVTRKGKPVSVILPIKAYKELLERAEDAADVAWLKRARRKTLRYRSLNEYLVDRRRR
jgi:hypothetical protein